MHVRLAMLQGICSIADELLFLNSYKKERAIGLQSPA